MGAPQLFERLQNLPESKDIIGYPTDEVYGDLPLDRPDLAGGNHIKPYSSSKASADNFRTCIPQNIDFLWPCQDAQTAYRTRTTSLKHRLS